MTFNTYLCAANNDVLYRDYRLKKGLTVFYAIMQLL
jgi:hypothetical protein